MLKCLKYSFVLFALLLTSLAAHAQAGNVKITTSTHSSGKGGVHTDGVPPIGSFEVYLMGLGSTPNATGKSMISCDYDDGGSTVGSDDGDTTCYAVANSGGGFNLTGLYYNTGDSTGCQGNETVYVEVRQGNPGSGNNSAIAYVEALPSYMTCDYLNANANNITLVVTEFTNEVAAFALAPFANFANSTSADGLSASGTAGLNAFKTAVDTVFSYVGSSGYYGGSDSNLQRQLNTIADIQDSCVYTTGPSSTQCSHLFSYTTDNGFTGTHVPFDTWQAVASMAQDPTHQVTNEDYLVSPQAGWQPNDNTPPSSWTIYTSGAPVLNSVTATTGNVTSTTAVAGKKATFATIYGTGLTSSASPNTCPVVVVGFQAVDVTAAGTTCSSTSLTVKLPAAPAQSAIGVYVGGLTSNFLPFTIKAN